MKAQLKAFRDALVAESSLTSLVIASSIYAGIRDEKTPIPCIDVFIINENSIRFSGGKVGALNKASLEIQVSIFSTNEVIGQTISDKVIEILLKDNTTLNIAGIRNIHFNGSKSLKEVGISHIPLEFLCNYLFTVT